VTEPRIGCELVDPLRGVGLQVSLKDLRAAIEDGERAARPGTAPTSFRVALEHPAVIRSPYALVFLARMVEGAVEVPEWGDPVTEPPPFFEALRWL